MYKLWVSHPLKWFLTKFTALTNCLWICHIGMFCTLVYYISIFKAPPCSVIGQNQKGFVSTRRCDTFHLWNELQIRSNHQICMFSWGLAGSTVSETAFCPILCFVAAQMTANITFHDSMTMLPFWLHSRIVYNFKKLITATCNWWLWYWQSCTTPKKMIQALLRCDTVTYHLVYLKNTYLQNTHFHSVSVT